MKRKNIINGILIFNSNNVWPPIYSLLYKLKSIIVNNEKKLLSYFKKNTHACIQVLLLLHFCEEGIGFMNRFR